MTTILLNLPELFTEQVVQRTYHEMIETMDPIPTLCLKSIMTSLSMFAGQNGSSMQPFTLSVLHKLVKKKVWTMDTLFEGFIRLCLVNFGLFWR